MLHNIYRLIVRPDLSCAIQSLHYSVSAWILIALVGQWLFATYVLVMYGYPFLSGSLGSADFSHTITGYIEGDDLGNGMLAAHVLPAAIISISGIFQLIPFFRRVYPKVHKWNGRLFLSVGLLGALTGLYLAWVRGSRLSDIGALGITLNGILIPITIYFAWKYARLRRFDIHERWAIHSFLLINGVWTFRLYLMAWYIINQGSNGNTEALDGPADIAISFACYLLPMCIAELVFWAKRQHSILRVSGVTMVVLIGVVITVVGVVSAATFMWFPRVVAAFS